MAAQDDADVVVVGFKPMASYIARATPLWDRDLQGARTEHRRPERTPEGLSHRCAQTRRRRSWATQIEPSLTQPGVMPARPSATMSPLSVARMREALRGRTHEDGASQVEPGVPVGCARRGPVGLSIAAGVPPATIVDRFDHLDLPASLAGGKAPVFPALVGSPSRPVCTVGFVCRPTGTFSAARTRALSAVMVRQRSATRAPLDSNSTPSGSSSTAKPIGPARVTLSGGCARHTSRGRGPRHPRGQPGEPSTATELARIVQPPPARNCQRPSHSRSVAPHAPSMTSCMPSTDRAR